jgi:CheY-like chemotaxis protein
VAFLNLSQALAEVPQPAATRDSSGTNDRHLTLTTSSIYSVIEVETMEFCPVEFSLPSFLEEIVNLFRIRAQGKGIAFTYHSRDPLPDQVQADERQLRKILEHLLNHAIQITEAGGVTFTVEVLNQSSPSEILAPDSQLRFQVEDTGCGLTVEALNLGVLESASHRRCSHLTPTQELGFIQQLIGRMGSTLHAHSLPGVGSLVWIDMTFPSTCHLPIVESSTDGAKDRAVPQCQSDQPSPLRILLAEDIPLNQKLALRILKRLGYKADLVTNGIEVLDALGRQVYDVVFMDIQMPKMDGLEATRRIRQELPNDRHPWIIALTANTAIGDRDACLAVGMNDYLSKPIDIEALEQSLLQCPIASRSLERKSS